MRIVVIGLGLIGGSFALGLRKSTLDCQILGYDTNENHLDRALELGLVSGKADQKAIADADLVMLAIPVNELIKELPNYLGLIKDDGLLMDAGSTKGPICDLVRNHPKRRNFLASHPIAGTEFTGPDAAIVDLYHQKTNIICEIELTAMTLQDRALSVFNALGMRIRYMNPKEHDKHIAFVSHLSHISSFMLGKTVMQMEESDRDIFDLAGSGFESTVRLAKSSPNMWVPIFEQNKTNVLQSLGNYIDNLTQFKLQLEKGEYGAMHSELQQINSISRILNGLSLAQE